MALKIGVIGAGSTYTPELVEGFLQRAESIPLTELVLMDIDEAKLSIVGGLAQRMVQRAGSSIDVRLTTDRTEAIASSTFVLTQMRIGRLQARRKDELIPRRLGYIGQETTGPGGFAKALRTIPVILDIAHQMEEHAPGATMINFTNPAGIITEAVLNHSRVNAIGLCTGPIADGTVLQHSGALERLPSGVCGLGDKAYLGVGGGRVATPRRKPRGKPRPPEDVVFNRAFAQVRIGVEHTIRDLRLFQALTLPDRHRPRGQPARVCAVVGLRARRCRPGRRDQRRAA